MHPTRTLSQVYYYPAMPPYDPAKQAPIPFEADILRLLKEHAAKQKPKPK